eukprot:UC1_evm1s2079
MMLLFYEEGLRVVIHSANMIPKDWGHMTNGAWVSPLLPKSPTVKAKAGSQFQVALVEYLRAYQSVCKFSKHKMQIQRDPIRLANGQAVHDAVARYDFSTVRACFVASVPGYHSGTALNCWGHIALRKVVPAYSEEDAATATCDQLVCQYSSIGSMGRSRNHFLYVAKAVTSAGPRLRHVWPTLEQVRASFTGYIGGGSICNHKRNEDAHKHMLLDMHPWHASWCGRTRLLGHIKTFCRYRNSDKTLAWAYLGSHNLSQAAWGKLQKGDTQLFIRSYEAGVVVLPPPGGKLRPYQYYGDDVHQSMVSSAPDIAATTIGSSSSGGGGGGDGSSAASTTAEAAASESPVTVDYVPLPYDLPLRPYQRDDAMWFQGAICPEPDAYGHVIMG